MSTSVAAAQALRLPFVPKVSLFDELAAKYGFEPVAVEPVAVEPVAVEPVAVEPVAVEPVAFVVEPVAVEPVAVEPVAFVVEPDHGPVFIEDVAPHSRLVVEVPVELADVAVVEADVDEDDVTPLWQETVLPAPTEADEKAIRSLLDEIAVYSGDDIPALPPFAHDHPEHD